jgi:hypothetical protein
MLPLPRFVLHPLTAMSIAVVHVYLAAGQMEWTHIWKGTGAFIRRVCVRCIGITRSCKATTTNYCGRK